MGGFHAPGELLLRKTGCNARGDDRAGQFELRRKRLVGFAILGGLHPFPVKFAHFGLIALPLGLLLLLLRPDRLAPKCRKQESCTRDGSRLLHAAIELAHGDVQKFRRLGLRDGAFGKSPVAETLKAA